MQRINQQINTRKRQSSNPPHARRCLAAPALAALLTLWATSAHAQSRADYCGDYPAGFDRPISTSPVGRYLNQTYGYSVIIPKGLTALSEASGPRRGFVIGLSVMPRALLRVDAYYDAFYDITAAGVHQRDLNAIRLHDTVVSDDGVDTLLGRNPARRFLMRLQCRGSPALIIHEEIIAVRSREIYRLDLQSTPERYPEDVRYLNTMLRSWRWEAVR